MRELLESLQYMVLGVMVTGGIAATVAGSRSLQGIIRVDTEPGMPIGLLAVILGCVSFGLAAGYLMKEVESGEWNEVLDK